jgi:hypothetical protein
MVGLGICWAGMGCAVYLQGQQWAALSMDSSLDVGLARHGLVKAWARLDMACAGHGLPMNWDVHGLAWIWTSMGMSFANHGLDCANAWLGMGCTGHE